MEVCLLTMPGFVWLMIGLLVGAGAAAAFFILREKNAERTIANA